MKKVLIGIISTVVAGVVMASDFVDVVGNQHDRVWKEMQSDISILANGGTLTNGLTVSGTTALETVTVSGGMSTTGSATSKGRATVTSASTSDTMVQGYTCNSAAQLNATSITQAFSTVFTTVPAVTFSGPTNELDLAITALTTNSVTIGTLSASNATIRVIAVGLKSN